MMAAARILGLAALGLWAAPLPAGAQSLSQINLPAERAAIEGFQDLDQRLQNIGWKMVRGNARFCDRVIGSVGLQLQDIASYGRPDIAKAALGLEGAFAVQTAAAGSPAALSGTFARNREITRIENDDPNQWKAGKRMDWERLTRVHDRIDAALKNKGAVTFRFLDGVTRTLKPVPVCATRFELLGESKTAVSDGGRVVIGTRFPGFGWEDDAEFAGVVAHELAHNLLGHRAWLKRNKRSNSHIRKTEREADRLMPWLLANAGYDPEAAYRFMVRWGKRHDPGLLRSWAYEGWDERAEHIAAELPLIADLIKREGHADWSRHFRREIDPNKGLKKGRGG